MCKTTNIGKRHAAYTLWKPPRGTSIYQPTPSASKLEVLIDLPDKILSKKASEDFRMLLKVSNAFVKCIHRAHKWCHIGNLSLTTYCTGVENPHGLLGLLIISGT